MAEGPRIAAPRRGEIHVVSFDPTLGAEIKKTRPALVIQNDIGNRHSPITIVAAISSKVDEILYPTEVPVRKGEGGLTADSVILLNQIRSIDRARLVRRLGRVSAETLRRVDQAIALSLGLLRL